MVLWLFSTVPVPDSLQAPRKISFTFYFWHSLSWWNLQSNSSFEWTNVTFLGVTTTNHDSCYIFSGGKTQTPGSIGPCAYYVWLTTYRTSCVWQQCRRSPRIDGHADSLGGRRLYYQIWHNDSSWAGENCSESNMPSPRPRPCTGGARVGVDYLVASSGAETTADHLNFLHPVLCRAAASIFLQLYWNPDSSRFWLQISSPVFLFCVLVNHGAGGVHTASGDVWLY